MSLISLTTFNGLIDEVNAALPCISIPHKGPGRWAKSDWRTIHEAISSVCDFPWAPIPNVAKLSQFDEVRAALQQCSCCGADLSLPFLNDLNVGGNEDGGYKTFLSTVGGPFFGTFDWAAWATQETVPSFNEEIPLAINGPLLVPSGGPGFVGRQYKSWEVRLGLFGQTLTTIASGKVSDGYLVLGDDATQLAWTTYGAALKQERQAIVAEAAAHFAYQVDPTQANEDAWTAAQADLATATAVRMAAESEAVNNPQTKNYRWRVVRFAPGSVDVWRLQGLGSGIEFAPVDGAQFRTPGFVVSELDSPYVLNQTEADISAEGVLHLSC